MVNAFYIYIYSLNAFYEQWKCIKMREIRAMFPAYETEKEIRDFFLIFKRWVKYRIKTLTQIFKKKKKNSNYKKNWL